MRITIEYFARDYTEGDAATAPRFQQIIDGVNDADAVIGPGYFDNAYAQPIDSSNPVQQALGITKSPTVIFVNADSGKAVGKLEGMQITRRRVKELYLYLARLENPAGTDDYITPDGQPVTEEQLFNNENGMIPGSFGGLFGCPSWLPDIVCKIDTRKMIMVVIAAAVIAFLIFKNRR